MLENVIFLIISLVVLLLAIAILLNIKKIAKEGIEVEGIIFDLEATSNAGNNTATIYPVVRFLTQTKEWITETSKISTIPGMHKKGEKVIVVYQQGNPKNFFIKEKMTYAVPAIMILVSIILIIIGVIHLIPLMKAD